MYSGDLDDSYHEFMIKEDATVSREALEEDFNAQYWDSRYTLREEHVPRILKRYATKALIAGKYLNVIRECKSGGLSTRYERRSLSHSSTRGAITADNIALPTKKKLTLDKDVTDTNLALAIDEAYQFSSQALLQLLEQGHGLSSQLQSLRRFFLLEHGDFFTQFMDTAETELRKDVKDISLVRVEGLLQLAVQTSTLGTDNNKENLTCTLASHNLIQHLHLIQVQTNKEHFLVNYYENCIISIVLYFRLL